MGKISIFKPVLDLPLGTYPVPVEGKFICMHNNTQFTIYKLPEENTGFLSLGKASKYKGSFEFSVFNKKYSVIEGILSKV